MKYFHRFVSYYFAMFFKVGLNFDTESAWKGVKAVSKTWKKVLSKYKEENISVANLSNIDKQICRKILVWTLKFPTCPFLSGQTLQYKNVPREILWFQMYQSKLATL